MAWPPWRDEQQPATPGVQPPTPGQQAQTATPGQRPPFPAQYPGREEFLEGFGEWQKKRFAERMPILPTWGEWLGYQGGQQFWDLMGGPQGLTRLEQEAVGGAQGLLAPQPPGGTAFAGIADALAPYITQQRERGGEAMAESLAAAGMYRTGAGQQLMSDYEAQTGMNVAAALAPFAMQGQALQQQGQLAAIPYLGGFGETEFTRPYSVLSQYMPGFLSSMSGAASPQQEGAGFWDYAVPLLSAGIGAL